MKDSRVYLAQILECITKIKQYTKGGKEEFFKSTLTQDAVIRNFQVIGEASKRLSGDYRDKHPEIPWRTIIAFRNVLTHDYSNVSLEEVWRIIEEKLPQVKSSIKETLPPLAKLEEELAGEDE